MKHLKCERDGDERTHHSWHLLILGCLSPTNEGILFLLGCLDLASLDPPSPSCMLVCHFQGIFLLA